jgi:SAM-dependent methyltransferase
MTDESDPLLEVGYVRCRRTSFARLDQYLHKGHPSAITTVLTLEMNEATMAKRFKVGCEKEPLGRSNTSFFNMNASHRWSNMLFLCNMCIRITRDYSTSVEAFVPSGIVHLSHPSADVASRWHVLQEAQSEASSLEWSKKKEDTATEFVSNVQQSINNGSFLSLTIRGVKRGKSDDVSSLTNPWHAAPYTRNGLHVESTNGAHTAPIFVTFHIINCLGPTIHPPKAASLRGCIRLIQGRLIEVQSKEKVLQLSIKYHGATDIFKNWKLEDVSLLLPNLILDPSGMMMTASEWGEAAVRTQPLRGAELQTLQSVWELQLASKKPKLTQKRRTSTGTTDAASTRLTSLLHDRVKQVPLSNDADFLQALGVTSAEGKPRPGMTSKLRQCQKFVEIVGGLVQKKVPTAMTQPKSISVVDMGCGRGYLTFSLHAYLTEHFDHVRSCGIDVRPKLLEEISDIANSLGGDFKTLTFKEGTIEGAAIGASGKDSTSNEDGELDILIALHACDTATDDAIWSGICRRADIIVVAPCCHKQIRPQLNSHAAAQSKTHPLADVLRHGVYRERLSETVTDSIRALLLERAGYKVQVFEFIGGEHTSKNVMITAIKCDATQQDLEDAEARIQSLASFHGIRQQKLAEWTGVQLGDGPGGDAGTSHRKLSVHRMPPR